MFLLYYSVSPPTIIKLGEYYFLNGHSDAMSFKYVTFHSCVILFGCAKKYDLFFCELSIQFLGPVVINHLSAPSPRFSRRVL